MTTNDDFNADDLDALISGHRNLWYERGCAVGQFILDLPEGDYRTRLIAHMGNLELGHTALGSAISATGGPSFRADSLRRHRIRQCSCSDRAWT